MNSETEVLKALSALEDKLTGVINAGLQGVNLAIAALADQHNRSLLDQERRNATFAARDRLETVAAHVHEIANTVSTNTYRLAELEKVTGITDGRVDRLGESINARSITMLGGATGYLVMLILMLASNLLTFLLAHAVH